MNILPTTDVDITIKNILPWFDKKPQGYSFHEIKEQENRLGVILPDALKYIYKSDSVDNIFSSQNIILVELGKLVIDNQKLIFALSYTDEIEGVKYWSINIEAGADQNIYARLGNDEQWVKEKFDLNSFINLYLYRQAIKSTYKHCGIIGLSGNALYDILEADWTKVVDYNGLHVYWQENALIWTIEFGEDEDIENDIFFSTYSEEIYYLNEIQYELSQI